MKYAFYSWLDLFGLRLATARGGLGERATLTQIINLHQVLLEEYGQEGIPDFNVKNSATWNFYFRTRFSFSLSDLEQSLHMRSTTRRLRAIALKIGAVDVQNARFGSCFSRVSSGDLLTRVSKASASRSNVIEKQQRLVVRVGDLDVVELILLRRLQLDTLNDLYIIGPVDL